MVLFIDSFKDGIKLSIAKYQEYLFPVAMDVSFFILYGAIMGGIFKKAMFYLIQAGYTALSLYKDEQSASLFDIMFSFPETQALLLKISFLLFLTLVLIFFAYGFTQGAAWTKAKSILTKTKTKKYLQVFFRVNLVWFSLFIFYKLIFLMFKLGSLLSERAVQQTKSTGEYIFLFIFLYFVFLSYALIKEESTVLKVLKQTIKIGFLKAPKLIPTFLLFGIILLGLHYLLIYITPYIPSQISLALSMFILLPALTFGRIYLFSVVNKVEKT